MNQVVMIAPMAGQLWNQVREWIDEKLAQLGESREWLANKAGLSSSALSQFFTKPERGMRPSTLAKVEKVLGPSPVRISSKPDVIAGQEDQSPIQSYGSKLYALPLVDIRRFPLGLQRSEMREKLEQIRMGWVLAPVPDPDAFALHLPEAISRYRAGAQVIISPANRPIAGDRAAVELPDRLTIAECFEVNGELVPTVDGKAVPAARIHGRVMGQFIPE
jgi:hypothetical protein